MIYIIVKLNHQTYCFSSGSIGGRNLCWNRWQLSGQALKPEPPKIRPLWTQTLCWREFWIWSFLRKLETMGEFDLCPTTVKCIFCFNFSLWLKRVGLEVFNQYWRIWFWSVFVRVTFSWKCFVWRNTKRFLGMATRGFEWLCISSRWETGTLTHTSFVVTKHINRFLKISL